MTIKIKLQLFIINASIHHEGLIKLLATQEEINILFLPPFYPELVEVEAVFAGINNKVNRNLSKTKRNLQNFEGKKKIIIELQKFQRK